MSRLTALPIKVTPEGASGLTTTSAAATYTYGSWVEVVASTAASFYLAGIRFEDGSPTNTHWFIEMGYGAAGSEITKQRISVYLESGANNYTFVVMLPVPLEVVSAAGQRVAIRVAQGTSVSAQTPGDMALLYYDTAPDHSTAATQNVAPETAAMASVAANTSAWGHSSWAELVASAGSEYAILGLLVPSPNSGSTDVEYEADIGIGAAGVEIAISTLRATTVDDDAGFNQCLWLPAPYPVVAGTRIAYRLRKSDTAAFTSNAALVYVGNTALLAQATITPGTGWTEVEEVDEDNDPKQALSVISKVAAEPADTHDPWWTTEAAPDWAAVAMAIKPIGGGSQTLTFAPDAEGATVNWVPSTGSDNSDNVDESSADDYTTYNESKNPGDTDLFTFDNTGVAGEVTRVTFTARAIGEFAGCQQLVGVCRVGGVTYEHPIRHAVTAAWADYSWDWEKHPGTGATWQSTDLGTSGAQFGYRAWK